MKKMKNSKKQNQVQTMTNILSKVSIKNYFYKLILLIHNYLTDSQDSKYHLI